jgi:hypothetical protein
MSRLEYLARPLVAFDPNNKDHRRYYWEFMAFRGWGSCPVRFICTEDHGDNLPAMIQRIMVEYYVHKEFKNSKSSSKLKSIRKTVRS